jgi:di/tricarboxylate transporter
MTPSLKLLSAIAAAAILFGIGVAVGEALHDNPRPNLTVTHTKTLTP